MLGECPSRSRYGFQIRLKGQGGKGSANGPPGDLVITFNVLRTRSYKRDGLDVIATVPAPHSAGNAGYQDQRANARREKSGDQDSTRNAVRKALSLRGQGIQKGDKKGDLIVEVSIQVPRSCRRSRSG